MPQLENGEDPIIVAALIDDDDDEESKQLTKEFLDQAKSEDNDHEDDADDEDEDDNDDADDTNPKDPADKNDDDDEEEKPSGVKPPEAIDAGDDTNEDDKPKDDDAEKKSRSERRAERRRQYLERLQVPTVDPNEQRRKELLANDDYKPLDLKDGEYEIEDLVKDRQAYAQAQVLKTAEAQRQMFEEQNFWTGVENDAKSLNTKPGFEFLDEDNKEKYDEKKVAAINDLYFKVIGFENVLVRDANGLPIVNDKGEAMVRPTVRRKDLTYKEFVEGYVENMLDFEQDAEAEIIKNTARQRAHQGVRPGGSSRKGIGRLRQGDIAKMSADDFEANEAEIDRQINAELGIG